MATDKTEVRGLMPAELAQALDALAHAEGQDRNAYIVAILDSHVRVICHKQTLVARMMRGNAYLQDALGGTKE
jgi:hypothetical protein